MENICSKESDDYIKELIYNKKVIIFGMSDCDFTKKAKNHFNENYNFNPTIFNIDNDNDNDKNKNFKKENLISCLKKRTKINITPMIYLNGMFIGNFKDLENKTFLKELEIFF